MFGSIIFLTFHVSCDRFFFCLESSLLHHYNHRINRLASNRWISTGLFCIKSFLFISLYIFGAMWFGWHANPALLPLCPSIHPLASIFSPFLPFNFFDLGGLFMFGDVAAWPGTARLFGLLRIYSWHNTSMICLQVHLISYQTSLGG